MSEKPAYRWKITKVHLDFLSGEKGVQGPRNLDPDITDNPIQFWMYDDDDECYYEGMLYGDYDGFEPLDDFGMPNAGCVHIKLQGDTHYL